MQISKGMRIDRICPNCKRKKGVEIVLEHHRDNISQRYWEEYERCPACKRKYQIPELNRTSEELTYTGEDLRRLRA